MFIDNALRQGRSKVPYLCILELKVSDHMPTNKICVGGLRIQTLQTLLMIVVTYASSHTGLHKMTIAGRAECYIQ